MWERTGQGVLKVLCGLPELPDCLRLSAHISYAKEAKALREGALVLREAGGDRGRLLWRQSGGHGILDGRRRIELQFDLLLHHHLL